MSGGRAEAAGRPDVFACRFDGGLVLADPRSRRLLAYNESAGVIWNALALGTPVDSVAALLTRTYGISLAQATGDLNAIVAHWRQQDLFAGEASAPATGAIVARLFGENSAAEIPRPDGDPLDRVRRRLQRRVALPTPLLWTLLHTIRTRPVKLLELLNPRKLAEQLSRVPGYVKQYRWK